MNNKLLISVSLPILDISFDLEVPNIIKVGSLKNIILDYGGYREVKYAEDYDLWLRLASEKRKFVLIEEDLLKYRIRETSITRKSNGLQLLTTIYLQKLFIERLKKNTDSFSIDNHMAFLNKYKSGLSFITENKTIANTLSLFFGNKTFRMYVIHKIRMIAISQKIKSGNSKKIS